MSTMPRPKGKGQKIAFNILGKPVNMQEKKSKKKKKVESRLTFEQISRGK